MTNLIVWLVVGSAAGWIASVAMKTEAQSAVALNVVLGIIGAVLGGSAVAPLVGTASGTQNDLSVPALFTSFVGAAVFLVAIQYFRRKPAP
jgi:uncharacterized membrane protein YeaQ/YmgE (transglycosylase-associated protein family)